MTWFWHWYLESGFAGRRRAAAAPAFQTGRCFEAKHVGWSQMSLRTELQGRGMATQVVSQELNVHHKLLVLLVQINNKVTIYSGFAETLLDGIVAKH